MELYSTKNTAQRVSLKQAVFQALPPDNGLYMPAEIPSLSAAFIENLDQYSFADIGYEISKALLKGAIPDNDLLGIVEKSINFPAPLVSLGDNAYILELFHGPSLAFKDFGARFMAQLMSYFNRSEEKELVILVATSGDTGGAVAAGFHNAPGIKVVILYPSGKVSPLQEKQLTTLGGNVSALEVKGSFDDCQSLVKQAFLDKALRESIRISSANSINIARLIPQTFYYFEAYKQLPKFARPPSFCIPSGNFGNLTAGLLAHRMGLPIRQFIAATNQNDVVPAYLKSGNYQARTSVSTISNAMDVGAPSNFARMKNLFGASEEEIWQQMQDKISGFSINDERTREAMREVKQRYDYTIDPHAAVGYAALRMWQDQQIHDSLPGIVLGTAHPAKFLGEVEETLQASVDVPARLKSLADSQKEATSLEVNYETFHSFLMDKYT